MSPFSHLAISAPSLNLTYSTSFSLLWEVWWGLSPQFILMEPLRSRERDSGSKAKSEKGTRAEMVCFNTSRSSPREHGYIEIVRCLADAHLD